MSTVIEPGAVIDGKYRVVRRIGEGGMGTVYEGENVRIERKVAIKVLHAHVASSPEFAQRFEREARASAKIDSPYVCDVLDLGDLPSGDKFIVMEFLEGESLEDRLGKEKLTAAELAPIAFEILEGLGTMHQAGVIHRDLKPANIFLQRRGKVEVVKILDFGVAKILPKADDPSQMTSTGMMMGTPLYMSPEQARGARDVDGRTDLYAASVIFYRALTGEMPHLGENLHELLFKIVLEEPKPICELVPDCDPTFAAIVTRGLARDPDQRFGSAREYQEEIATWGAAQGRSSLQFAVTLPSEPPQLKSLSGGFPAARLGTPITPISSRPITGPQPRSENAGPPTPAVAKTQAETSAAKKQSGGTPIVWSEDAPKIAKEAHAAAQQAESERREGKDASGKTRVIASRPAPPPDANAPTSEPLVPPPSASQPPGRSRLLAVGAVLAIAALAVGARLSSQGSPAPAPSTVAASAPIVTPEPPPPVTAQPTTPVAVPAPSASASASAAPSAIAAPVVPAVARPVAAATGAPTPKASPSETKSAAPAASTAAPTPTTSGRKFRTNID